jgi:hypothetical protein
MRDTFPIVLSVLAKTSVAASSIEIPREVPAAGLFNDHGRRWRRRKAADRAGTAVAVQVHAVPADLRITAVIEQCSQVAQEALEACICACHHLEYRLLHPHAITCDAFGHALAQAIARDVMATDGTFSHS